MAGNRGSLVPSPHITAFMSNPASECAGSALTTTQGAAITCTRAATAYCTRSADGIIIDTAANTCRVTNDGVLVEGSRTNLIIRTTQLDNAAWTKVNLAVTANQGPDPEAGSFAELLNPTDTLGASAYIESTAFVPSQTTGKVSVYVKPASAVTTQQIKLEIYDTTAGASRGTCTTTLTNVWTRLTCEITGQTGANNHVLRIYPDFNATDQASVLAYGAHYETPPSTLMSSYITTVGSSANRGTEGVTFANGQDISTAGCLSATVTFPPATLGINSSGGTILGNAVEKMLGYTSNTAMSMNDGTNTVTANVTSVYGRTIAMKSSWSAALGTMTLVADGVTSTGAFDGSFSSTATIRVGSLTASQYAYTYIKNIKVGAHPNSCD